MGQPKFMPPAPKHAKRVAQQPPNSVILALETAVLLLEQNGYTEEMIYGLVNCILQGFITNGAWTPEYIQAVEKIEKEREAELEAESRAQALRESISSSTITRK
jgi:hypothetical protein